MWGYLYLNLTVFFCLDSGNFSREEISKGYSNATGLSEAGGAYIFYLNDGNDDQVVTYEELKKFFHYLDLNGMILHTVYIIYCI